MEQGGRIEDVYDIDKEIGVGTYSFVHLATHRESKKQYAVKIIDKTLLTSKQRERLYVEVEIVKNLDHPYIISVYETFETKNQFYIVMEIMNGGDLFDKIVQKKRYSEQEARVVIQNMVKAIDYLHQKGLVHRDLKPENIMLSSKDDCTVVKIADFGFARVVRDGHLLTTPCGSPGYIAPEIANEQGYTKDVDMWSVGVIMYTMLAGFPPFYAETDEQLLERVAEGKFSFPSSYWKDISAAAKDLIRKLLEKNPSLRYTARQVLAHPWIVGEDSLENNCLNTEAVQTPPKHQSHIRSALNKSIDAQRDGCFLRSATESSIMKRRRRKNKDQQNQKKLLTAISLEDFDSGDELIFNLELGKDDSPNQHETKQ